MHGKVPLTLSQLEGGIGVRANIHLGGQTEFCPNMDLVGGMVAEIFRDPYSVGGGGSSRNFPSSLPERARFGGGGVNNNSKFRR